MGEPSGEPPKQLNVLGLPIELCCQDPVPFTPLLSGILFEERTTF